MNGNTNGNGAPLDPLAGIQAVPVHSGVVQALSDALDRARRGEIHAVIIVGARATDLASFDTIVVDNMALAMVLQGAMLIAQSKVTQGARDAQQQAPVSRIVRPPANMNLG